MKELKRRALLGDKWAQEECTRRGIVLQCPFCGGLAELTEEDGLYAVICKDERCIASDIRPEYGGAMFALADWNTRQAPPIGRCGECAHWYKQHCATGPCAAEKTDADFYCSNFKLRECEENGELYRP